MLPVYDFNPTRSRPVVTLWLIAVNVAVFVMSPLAWPVLESASQTQELDRAAFVCSFGAIPLEMFHWGTQAPCQVLPGSVELPFVVNAFTAMFVHGGWGHLLGNMLFLWVFGNNVEDRLGRSRFLVFYLVCGVLATVGFSLADWGSAVPLVGASGAIAAVLGAYLLLYPRALVLTMVGIFPIPLPSFVVLGFWFVLQWAYATGYGAAEGSVAFLAHVIGFAAGFLYILLFGQRFRPPPGERGGRRRAKTPPPPPPPAQPPYGSPPYGQPPPYGAPPYGSAYGQPPYASPPQQPPYPPQYPPPYPPPYGSPPPGS